jgi:thiol-disulfide isomerase/thioredoxin
MDTRKKIMRDRMRSILFLCTVVAVAGCSGPTVTRDGNTEEMALGIVDRAVLTEPKFHEFQARYDTVTPSPDFVQMIKALNHDVDVIVFFGTWCGDSKREVPRFLKVADQAGIAGDRITLYGLDRSKKSEDGMTDAYQVDRVPTFIFSREGKEIGRITEHPETSIEEDMVHILAKADAQH